MDVKNHLRAKVKSIAHFFAIDITWWIIVTHFKYLILSVCIYLTGICSFTISVFMPVMVDAIANIYKIDLQMRMIYLN